ncbi:xanthine dehydrogenase family protein molybdopterin-binding subunit [Gillisia sp. Hel_I_29]|uniref:xanthine dehydrogenase family protein molybdopterin-binding subunit n=1 Tax=Gillisia sp. Hel_I_29 TaxID=1249975 RepID=UPI0005513342|nr:xanthine dehydrogenase family protein molybdopterin-binding subunit [Gillisia sp. Hel_I_29]
MKTSHSIGKPIDRLEGHLKVTGAATYAAEYEVGDLLHGYVVNSTITKGKIIDIDEQAARELPGVIEVFSHNNRSKLPWFDILYADMDAPPGTPFKPLYDENVLYNGQPIALVVAETFETARYAASLIKITYEESKFKTSLLSNLQDSRSPKKGMATVVKPLPPDDKGNFEKAYAAANVTYEGEFNHPPEHHNPLELFATTTVYEGKGKLTVYDKTQGTSNSQLYIANIFGLHYKNVRVIAPFVGGGFGSGLRPQYQLFLCVMASLQLKRNVRVAMDRSQMFTFGHRPPTYQKTKFGASKDGMLTALHHTAIAETSQNEDYNEVVVNWGGMLYPVKNTEFDYKLVSLDIFTPMDMRAPGGSTGMHAIETSMDALSYALNMDPLEFRLLNYSETDESANKPFSSKELKACYQKASEAFGWEQRNPKPRTTKRGQRLVGTGMSSGIWDVIALPGKAKATLNKKGQLKVKSAVTDIGTGTRTIMTQIAADSLGMTLDNVVFEYGDSKMPLAPIQGGSYTTGVIGSAVKAVCEALKKKILKAVKRVEASSFKGATLDDVIFSDNYIKLKKDPNIGFSFQQLVSDNGKKLKASKSNIPNAFKLKKYTRAAHSAAFVEVEVDEQLGTIKVTRAVTAVAAGKIINPKTASSQILGGMIWGIGKALQEETLIDHNLGKYMNTNLGEYHIPVHADINDLEVIFVEEKDDIINELGAKGVGEIGLVSMAPAIANAIYHATGKRINNFPIHFDDLL